MNSSQINIAQYYIPEYLQLLASPEEANTIVVSVKIDGKKGLIKSGHISGDTLATLVHEIAVGKLGYMYFDEHPKKLIRIVLSSSSAHPKVEIVASSISFELFSNLHD